MTSLPFYLITTTMIAFITYWLCFKTSPHSILPLLLSVAVISSRTPYPSLVYTFYTLSAAPHITSIFIKTILCNFFIIFSLIALPFLYSSHTVITALIYLFLVFPLNQFVAADHLLVFYRCDLPQGWCTRLWSRARQRCHDFFQVEEHSSHSQKDIPYIPHFSTINFFISYFPQLNKRLLQNNDFHPSYLPDIFPFFLQSFFSSSLPHSFLLHFFLP